LYSPIKNLVVSGIPLRGFPETKLGGYAERYPPYNSLRLDYFIKNNPCSYLQAVAATVFGKKPKDLSEFKKNVDKALTRIASRPLGDGGKLR
jgi:hypothetical protein